MGDASSEPVPDMRILKRKVALAGWPGGLGEDLASSDLETSSEQQFKWTSYDLIAT